MLLLQQVLQPHLCLLQDGHDLQLQLVTTEAEQRPLDLLDQRQHEAALQQVQHQQQPGQQQCLSPSAAAYA